MTAPIIDRRAFMSVCAAGCASIALQGCASLVTHPVPVVAGRARVRISDFPELLAPHGAIRIQPAGTADPIIVLAAGSGAYDAVSPICTHRGCTVDVLGERLVCPCHGSTYDRTGKVLKGPAQRALTRFPAELRGEELIITIVS